MNALKISTLITFLLFVSCTEHFEELNTDPNYPTDVPATSIFTQVIINSVDSELNDIDMAMWSQQWCAAQYGYSDRYGAYSYNFSSNYLNELLDLEIIMRKAEELIDKGSTEEIRQNRTLLAAAKIMRVWIFHFLTDMFGDVPYSEAVSGLDQDVIYTPKYDTQESIYMDFLMELAEANTLLDLSSVSDIGKGDLFFRGDPQKWKKFGNSLRLRILNRCAGTPWSFTYNMVGTGDFTTGPGPAAYNNADNEIAAMLGDPAVYPVISANEDNVCLTYPGLPDYRQPIYDQLYVRLDFVISETMVDWLKARNDPRLPVYAQVTQDYKVGVSTEPYVGEQNGRKQLSSYFPGISLLGTAVGYDEDAPLYVLTYDEIEFIKAEHYLRLGDETRTRAAYEAGIVASMERWGANLDNYLDEPKVNWDSAFSEGEKYQRILEQKWAGIFGQGWQAWHEVRRTGFPARIFEYELEWTLFPDLGLPIRKQYPSSEERDNGLNHDEAIKRQNIESRYDGMFSTDGIKSQMWWHTRKNPIPTEIDPPER
jgi:hypothetical protein